MTAGTTGRPLPGAPAEPFDQLALDLPDLGTAPAGGRGRRRLVPADPWPWLLGLAVALGVAARTWSQSALWLDEALSLGIARLPVPDLLSALRRDGSPPLYYLLLHAWIALVGEGDAAVRWLSTVCSLATLPVAWLLGRRLGGRTAAWAALLLLATSPFAVRYASEARMYALLQLLSAVGLLALLRALERPVLARLAPVAVVSGLLALTHYWALFLLAAAGIGLLLAGRRGPGRLAARRTLAALLAGGLVFAPWLPTFAFQVRRTGTPWAAAPRLTAPYDTVLAWSGGSGGWAVLLLGLLLWLSVLAVLARPWQPGARGLLLGPPADRPALLLLGASLGTLLLGLLAAVVVGAGYAFRYSSAALVPGLLLAALGVRALSPRAVRVVLALAAVAGLVMALPQPFSERRTQAARTAVALERGLAPGDLVVYCPDQLGPDLSRLLPSTVDQVVYPSLGDPGLVDWVDYAERNAAADPLEVAGRLDGRSAGAVWLVSAPGYRTFGTQCERLGEALERRRGDPLLWTGRSARFDQQQQVVRYPGRTAG